MVQIVLGVRANNPGFGSLDSSMKDRYIGWKKPKSKLCYLEAEQRIEVK